MADDPTESLKSLKSSQWSVPFCGRLEINADAQVTFLYPTQSSVLITFIDINVTRRSDETGHKVAGKIAR